MDEKKQKMMVGGALVLVVGFGAYIVFGRGDDGGNAAFTPGIAQRAPREPLPAAQDRDRPPRPPTTDASVADPGRPDRPRPRPLLPGRKPDHRPDKTYKKAAPSPAA